MLAIDSLAYASKIRPVDTKAKIFISGLPLILCIAFDGFAVSFMTIFFMAFLTVKYSAVSIGAFYKYMTIPLAFLIIGAAAVMVGRFPVGTDLILGMQVGNYLYGISGDTFVLGLKLAMRSLACLSCLCFFSFNTAMGDFFSFLHKTRLPKIFTALAELIYRYIFILLEESARVMVAQKSRLGYNGFKSTLKCLALLAGNLFIRAYARGERAYNALESRNYDENACFGEETFENGGKLYAIGAVLGVCLVGAGLAEKFAGLI